LYIATQEADWMARAAHWLLMLLDVFVALSAVGGGVSLAGATDGFPREWLEGSPFNSYVVPGLILAVAVGGAAAVASIAMIRRPILGAQLSTLAGLVLLGWIAGEMLLLHQNGAATSPRSTTELVYATVGLAMVLLGPSAARGRSVSAE
jgi:hypothetical protein